MRLVRGVYVSPLFFIIVLEALSREFRSEASRKTFLSMTLLSSLT